MKKLVLILLAFGLVALPAFAGAESIPASKATFAYDKVVALQKGCSSSDEDCPADSGWQTILKQKIKMPNQKDLFLGASLQCGIVTDTTVKSLNGSLDSAEARGTIRVRVKLTDADGIVSFAQPDSGVDATNTPDPANAADPAGVVFCDRIQTLKARFSGLNCVAAPFDGTVEDPDGPDNIIDGTVTCSVPEELELILKTLNANAFNYVAANRVPGVHTIEVQAKTSANVAVTGTNGSLGNANAFIGAGSVAVETVRMIKGNDGTTLVEFQP